jgi:hypothetical protein
LEATNPLQTTQQRIWLLISHEVGEGWAIENGSLIVTGYEADLSGR